MDNIDHKRQRFNQCLHFLKEIPKREIQMWVSECNHCWNKCGDLEGEYFKVYHTHWQLETQRSVCVCSLALFYSYALCVSILNTILAWLYSLQHTFPI